MDWFDRTMLWVKLFAGLVLTFLYFAWWIQLETGRWPKPLTFLNAPAEVSDGK